jgi:hypothetical protein
MQILCGQAKELEKLGFVIGPIKEASRPWFDYSIEGHEMRQGLVVFGDRVVTLVLSADTAASRAQYARTFDKTLRSLRALEVAKSGDADAAPTDGEAPPEEEVPAEGADPGATE